MVHLRQFIFFVVGANFTMLKPDIAGIIELVIFVDGHETAPAGVEKLFADEMIVDGQIGVSVENIKCLA